MTFFFAKAYLAFHPSGVGICMNILLECVKNKSREIKMACIVILVISGIAKKCCHVSNVVYTMDLSTAHVCGFVVDADFSIFPACF